MTHGDKINESEIEDIVEAAVVKAIGGPPMLPDTLFRISSMTKPITAAVILSLVDDGLLDLNGPVERLLPELAGRRVLRHAGGHVHGARAVADRDRGGGARAGLVRSAAAGHHPRPGHLDGAPGRAAAAGPAR